MLVILLFFIGIAVGFLFKKNKRIYKISDTLTNVSLYLLLLFLGISIGMNPDIISNFTQIGLKSLLFALGGMFGSILFILPLYLIFKKVGE